jgi:hypothetical protein
MNGPDGWLDMNGYASLDPDYALPGAMLGELRDVLLGHAVAPLSDGTWQETLAAATASGEPPGDTASAWTGADGTHQAPGEPWWQDHGTGGIDGTAHHPLTESHDTNPYFDGGHW